MNRSIVESYNVNIESEPVVHSPETPVYNSEYFADVVSSNEGDFIGLNLGDSRETVKGKLPEEAFMMRQIATYITIGSLVNTIIT